MRKKLFITMLLIMSIFLPGSAYEKASNKYAKEAKHIVLIANGFDSEDSNDRDNDIVISIVDFRTNKWIITIAFEDDDVVSGTFTLTDASTICSDPYFKGIFTNIFSGEKMEAIIHSVNKDIWISFNSLQEDKKVNLTYDRFYVDKDCTETHVLFHDLRSNFDLDDPYWKEGTTKQLKKCLSDNPYLRKLI